MNSLNTDSIIGPAYAFVSVRSCVSKSFGSTVSNAQADRACYVLYVFPVFMHIVSINSIEFQFKL